MHRWLDTDGNFVEEHLPIWPQDPSKKTQFIINMYTLYMIILLFYTYKIIVLQLDSQNYNVFVLLPTANPVLVCVDIVCV